MNERKDEKIDKKIAKGIDRGLGVGKGGRGAEAHPPPPTSKSGG